MELPAAQPPAAQPPAAQPPADRLVTAQPGEPPAAAATPATDPDPGTGDAAPRDISPELTREIAHDLRNLLTAIRGRAELLVASLSPGDPAAEDAAHVVVVSGTAFDLLDELDAPARRMPATPTDLDATVRDLGPVARALASRTVAIEMELGSAVRVTMARRHLERVLLNLVVNARDAMPDGGRITIVTHADGDGHATVRVVDSGSGFAEDALRHLFEPGYTTKRERGGSGRGLVGSRRIVEAAGGSLAVLSRAGQGAEVVVSLPVFMD